MTEEEAVADPERLFLILAACLSGVLPEGVPAGLNGGIFLKERQIMVVAEMLGQPYGLLPGRRSFESDQVQGITEVFDALSPGVEAGVRSVCPGLF